MYTYQIKFTRNGRTEIQVGHYKANNIASAFEKCFRKFPGVKLIEGRIESSYRDTYGVTRRGSIIYSPPSTVRVAVKPAPQEEQLIFDVLETLSAEGPQ